MSFHRIFNRIGLSAAALRGASVMKNKFAKPFLALSAAGLGAGVSLSFENKDFSLAQAEEAKKYKLVYFDVRALAECSRLLFAASGTPYEDVRLPFDFEKMSTESYLWSQIKPKTAFGKVPFLTVNSTFELAQSRAIERYLAKSFNLYGDSQEEAGLIDSFVDQIGDVRFGYRLARGEEETNKYIQSFPTLLKTLSNFAERNGDKGFIVGNRLSWGDIALYSYLESLRLSKDKNIAKLAAQLDQAPALLKIEEKVKSDPKIAAYLASRKPTAI